MTPEERRQTCRDLAGILARGYDLHAEAHGPHGAHAVRTPDGSRYEVEQTRIGGGVSFVERGDERFAVHVIPLADQDKAGPMFAYEPH